MPGLVPRLQYLVASAFKNRRLLGNQWGVPAIEGLKGMKTRIASIALGALALCSGSAYATPVTPPGEEAGLNRAADLLARVVRREAAAHGFAFVDPRAAFAAHELCAADPWLTGLSTPLVESFHPNASGHADGYAPPVYSALRWSD